MGRLGSGGRFPQAELSLETGGDDIIIRGEIRVDGTERRWLGNVG